MSFYKKSQDSPEGRKLCESYQNLDVGRSLPAVNYILPYRGGLVGWMFSLVLSFAPKERTDWGLGVSPNAYPKRFWAS